MSENESSAWDQAMTEAEGSPGGEPESKPVEPGGGEQHGGGYEIFDEEIGEWVPEEGQPQQQQAPGQIPADVMEEWDQQAAELEEKHGITDPADGHYVNRTAQIIARNYGIPHLWQRPDILETAVLAVKGAHGGRLPSQVPRGMDEMDDAEIGQAIVDAPRGGASRTKASEWWGW